MQEPSAPRSSASQARLIHLAWVAPAVCVAAASVRSMLLEAEGTAPGVALAAILAGLWILLSCLPAWRRTLVEIGELLVERLPFVALLIVTLLLLVIGAPRGPVWIGLTASAALVAFVVARRAVQREPRQLAFGMVLLAVNVALLFALDLLLGAFYVPIRSHNNIFTDHDDLLGWKLRQGVSVEHRHEDYVSRETINDLGFRTSDRPFEKPTGIRRILFLGDSHTEAYTVNDDETYSVLVEQRLADLGIEVIALGVGGYSTDQELLAYLHYGRRYQPDLVVLQFTTNDIPFLVLDHYWRGRKPRFERYGDLLALTGVPVPNTRNTGLFSPQLLRRSSIFLTLEMALRQLAVKRDIDVEADWEEAWTVFDLLIRDLEAATSGDGAELLVFQADGDPETNRRLRAVLERRSIPYIGIEGAYTDPRESYFAGTHWNAKGQIAVADELATALRARLSPVPLAGR